MSIPSLLPFCSCGEQTTGKSSRTICPNSNTGKHNFNIPILTSFSLVFTTTTPITSTTLSSKEKRVLRFTGRVKKRDEELKLNCCYICGFLIKLQASHIVNLQYSDEFNDYVFNHYDKDLPDCLYSTENGWLLCPNCLSFYDNDDLTVLSDGTIVCSDKLAVNESYKSLHGTKVVWANRINKPHYPTKELFDYVNKETNKRNLAEQFDLDVKSSGSKRKSIPNSKTRTTKKSASAKRVKK